MATCCKILPSQMNNVTGQVPPGGCNVFSSMDNDVWDHCSADTNAVDWKKQDSKDKILQQLQSAMINLYKADKYMCTKHMAAGCNFYYIQ